MDPIFDLIIYHHGSLSGPRMEYIGGDTMELDALDADRMCFWDLTNILEDKLGYNYHDIPMIHFKYDDQSNVEIHGLTTNQDFMTKILGIINGGRRKFHVFVDHAPDEPIKPIPIKLVPTVLISEYSVEVNINYSLRRMCHITHHNHPHMSHHSSLLCSHHNIPK